MPADFSGSGHSEKIVQPLSHAHSTSQPKRKNEEKKPKKEGRG
jgi:hypothetical protein